MGVVLSRYLVERELGPDGLRGWFFLDDYAEWLGQKEEHIADLMALNLHREGAGYRIGIIVTEAKYIDHDNLAAKRRESEKQLRDTVARMRRALFGEPPCLDRGLWLTRLGNLIVNGIHLPANAPLTTTDWVKALREGRCELYVRGYSHVFVSGPSDCPDCSESRELEDPEDSFQEVFSRSDVKRVVHDYLAGTDPGPLRRELSDGVDRTAKTYTRVTDSGAPVPQPAKNGSSSTAPEGATGQRTPVPDGEGPGSAANASTPPTTGGVGGDGAGPHAVRAVLMSAAPPDAPAEASSRAWLLEMESACKGALQQFHLKSKLLESKLTPNCALLKFQGSSNLTVDQVQKRQTEFLTSYGLKIVAVRPEPGRVAISIARPERQVITVGDAWRGWPFEQAANPCRLPVAVREEDGELLFLSPLTNAPHTLVAGSTNSGKSVLMQNLMLAIGCASTPEQSRITLIDPKGGVDYFAFVELPHLRQEMIVEMDGAVAALSALVEEMDERYRILRDRQATNLAEFNAKAVHADRLPFLWLIHDEFAEWMMQEEYSASVTNLVSRLGVKARAAGIFLVFAAQRPDKDVMPMQLRSQLGNRLILRVDSEGTSELALGEKGAERLLGRGHLAARLEGEADTVYAQVPFADSATILAAVKAIARQYSVPAST
jgi:S-DNA-T family DNA segregation ATPase FtsK/SpoIIIE